MKQRPDEIPDIEDILNRVTCSNAKYCHFNKNLRKYFSRQTMFPPMPDTIVPSSYLDLPMNFVNLKLGGVSPLSISISDDAIPQIEISVFANFAVKLGRKMAEKDIHMGLIIINFLNNTPNMIFNSEMEANTFLSKLNDKLIDEHKNKLKTWQVAKLIYDKNDKIFRVLRPLHARIKFEIKKIASEEKIINYSVFSQNNFLYKVIAIEEFPPADGFYSFITCNDIHTYVLNTTEDNTSHGVICGYAEVNQLEYYEDINKQYQLFCSQEKLKQHNPQDESINSAVKFMINSGGTARFNHGNFEYGTDQSGTLETSIADKSLLANITQASIFPSCRMISINPASPRYLHAREKDNIVEELNNRNCSCKMMNG